MPRSWACKDPNPNKPDLTLLRDEPSRLKTGINIEKQKPQCITLSCGLSFISHTHFTFQTLYMFDSC